MALALFDLDNTLLAGDSDYLWGEFLVRHGHVDAAQHARVNQQFMEDYEAGVLDMEAFLEFQLRPLKDNSLETLQRWHEQFMEEDIRPIMLDKGRAAIARHQDCGDTLMVVTATNDFITRPIVEALGIDLLLATVAEKHPTGYTGKVLGTPCFQAGKVTRLNQWLEENRADLSDSWFYSDSHNDIPLLEAVDNPIVVDGDETLRAHASRAGWDIRSFR